jgi:hypothetical protein
MSRPGRANRKKAEQSARIRRHKDSVASAKSARNLKLRRVAFHAGLDGRVCYYEVQIGFRRQLCGDRDLDGHVIVVLPPRVSVEALHPCPGQV